jgi:DNA-binding transcriptional ArsR family regulator
VGGRALTTTELAQIAGVTKQTVSAHLAKLLDAQLLAVRTRGGIATSALRSPTSHSCSKA